MPISLPPELLLRIVREIRHAHEPHHHSRLRTEKQLEEEISTLMSLLKTCKAVNQEASELYYKNCITKKVDTFAKALTDARGSKIVNGQQSGVLCTIERLQVYHDWMFYEPPYADVLREGWRSFGSRNEPVTPVTVGSSHNFDNEYGRFFEAFQDLQAAIAQTDGANAALPKLKVVTFGGLGDHTWNHPLKAWPDPNRPPGDRGFAHILLNLPTVEHACQYYRSGPLAVFNEIIKVAGPIKVFTYHQRPCYAHSWQDLEQPPVILGAINRYYYAGISVVFNLDPSPMMIANALAPLLGIVGIRRDKYLDDSESYTGRLGPRPVKFADSPDALDGTTIEIYGYVRIVDHAPGDPPFCSKEEFDRPKEQLAIRPPASLATFQRTLDQLMDPRWRGKVFLRNREDAPPCTACGLDPAIEWDYMQKKGDFEGGKGDRDWDDCFSLTRSI